MKIKKLFLSSTSVIVALAILFEQLIPTTTFASGPTQPEFSSFTSVNETGTVNEFTGSFNYNIPVVTIPGFNGGYAMSLSYNSDMGYEEDASWVGYGWTLNPGAIFREKRGFADDVNGATVRRQETFWPHITHSLTFPTGINLSSNLESISLNVGSGSYSKTFSIDENYTGKKITSNIGLSAFVTNMNYEYSTDNTHSFSYGFNLDNLVFNVLDFSNQSLLNGQVPLNHINRLSNHSKLGITSSYSSAGSGRQYTLYGSYLPYMMPNSMDSETKTENYKINLKLLGLFTNIGLEGGIDYMRSESASSASGYYKAFGYLYHDTAYAYYHGYDPASVEVNGSDGNVQLTSLEECCWDIVDKYGNTSNVEREKSILTDYTIEKPSPFKERSKYLPIPYAQKDVYFVQAEGLSGGMKLHKNGVDRFFPSNTKNTGTQVGLGLEAGFGTAINIGLDTKIKDALGSYSWEMSSSAGSTFEEASDDNTITDSYLGKQYFFALKNDPALSQSFVNEEAQCFASVKEIGEENLFSNSTLALQYPTNEEVYSRDIKDNDGILSSTHVGFHTIGEMFDNMNNGKYYSRYSMSSNFNQFINANDEDIKDRIGEFKVTNNDGTEYVFGLPVFSRYEVSVSNGYVADDEDKTKYDENQIVNNKISYHESTSSILSTSMVEDYAYPTAHLLTEIKSPDYRDLTGNGPSQDDLGGYVTFNYDQVHGSKSNEKKSSENGNWYFWRTPFNGANFELGSLSTSKDDMGSWRMGEKEVYYLKTVETNSHIAVFHVSDREDAVESANAVNDAISSATATGTKKLKKLDKIELYIKDSNGNKSKLISTTYFKYDYSLAKNQPSNKNTYSGNYDNSGKLTLKKVWTEYADVKNAIIYPYEFNYAYQSFGYPNKYSSIDKYNDLDGDGIALDQNPDYCVSCSDRWGTYREKEDGESRDNTNNLWVSQTESETFDPAAYKLKQIKLPTGGEIHIQYEERTYKYVQDKPAMAMVSLKQIDQHVDISGERGQTYYLNLRDLGIEGDQDKINELVRLMDSLYTGESAERIYFRILYSEDLNASALSWDKNNMEFIEGYAKIDGAVTYDAASQSVYFKLVDDNDQYIQTPQELCYDFYKSNRGREFGNGFDAEEFVESISDFEAIDEIGEFCEENESMKDLSVGDFRDLLGILKDALPFDEFTAFASLFTIAEESAMDSEKYPECKALVPSLSYMRIPVPTTKKGGGARVKRVLTFDKGNTLYGSTLYGNEYLYLDANGECSGVATNEPQLGKTENPLYSYLQIYEDQDLTEKILAGLDKEQGEGPIGENLLPSPIVCYSRVVKKNIHDGITNAGFSVSEYWTTKDYPTNDIIDYGSGMHKTVCVTEPEKHNNASDKLINFRSGFFVNRTDFITTQGYRFITHSMNGAVKSVTTYKGKYEDIIKLEEVIPTTQVAYEYYLPGEPVPLTKNLTDIEYGFPGKEVEVVEFSQYVSYYNTPSETEIDITIVAPIFMIMPNAYIDQTSFQTHILNKIIDYPTYIKSVRKLQDGVQATTDYLAFDPLSGKPQITQTYDGYHGLELAKDNNGLAGIVHNGSYYSYSTPAYKMYEEVGAKSYNEGKCIQANEDMEISHFYDDTDQSYNLCFKATSTNVDLCAQALNYLKPGDRLLVKEETEGMELIYDIDRIDGNLVKIFPTSLYNYTQEDLSISEVKILLSGLTNQLNASVENTITYGDKLDYAAAYSAVEYANRQAIVTVLQEKLNALQQGNLDFIGFKLNVCEDSAYVSKDASFQRSIDSNESNNNSSSNNGDNYLPDLGTILTEGNVSVNACTDGVYLSVKGYHEIYCNIFIPFGSVFKVDKETGDILMYPYGNNCCPIKIDCLPLCSYAYSKSAENIIAASATTLTDEWKLTDGVMKEYDLNGYSIHNDFELGLRGNWRAEKTLAYRESIDGPLSNPDKKSYTTGTFSYERFNFYSPEMNNHSKWIASSTVEMVSPNSQVLRTEDPLGISSVTKYGYRGRQLPYLVAANSGYDAVLFSSFEEYSVNGTSYELEEGLSFSGSNVSIDNSTSHSGDNSLKITLPTAQLYTSYEFDMSAVTLTEQILEEGVIIKMWVKKELKGPLTTSEIRLYTDLTGTVFFDPIKQTGEWTLYEGKIAYWNTDVQAGQKLSGTIEIFGGPESVFHIDDFKVQPTNSQVNAYVYDLDNLRPVAEFGDQHFGLYYQYDSEGRLIRKLIETEKGMKTVSESFVSIPGSAR